MGTTVQLYVAYFAERVYRSHICEFVLDSTRPGSDENARKFQVIRNTARMLRESYAMVHIGTCFERTRLHLLPSPSTIMPAPLPFHLKFLDRVGSGAYNDVFTGELSTHKHRTSPKVAVHVKFVDNYGVDAHRLLAEHKGANGEPRPLAPKLYWAGDIMPGRTMVIMESLPDDAHTLLWHQPPPEPDPEDPEYHYLKRLVSHGPAPVSWDELEDVRTAVELLHSHDFVHGDIRPQNVLLQRPSSASDSDDGSGGSGGGAGASRAYLIDFDRAGKEGTARYDPNLNSDIRWPRPVSELNGQLIKKEHDVFMLKRLLKVPKRKHKNQRGHREDGDADNRKSKRKRVSWRRDLRSSLEATRDGDGEVE